MEHKFYKFRRRWSSGPNKWEYVRLPLGETPKSFFGEMCSEYGWSEHFRGIDYRKVKSPPQEWLKSQIDSLQYSAKWRKELADEYERLLLCQTKQKRR